MPDTIYLDAYCAKVNKEFVGFGLYKGPKVKPVHIANGVFRVLYGKILNNKGIKKLALVQSKKGIKGFETTDIYDELLENERIEEDIKIEDFDITRRIIQKLLDADSGVFIDKSKSDQMLSFSVSSKYFLTKESLYEDAGEFIGSVVKYACPELSSYIITLLDQAKDPISQLFIPVKDDEVDTVLSGDNIFNDLFPEKKRNQKLKDYLNSLKQSSICLLHNLKKQPNTFTQLRLFNLFCVFSLFRYISYLEAFYCDAKCLPILIDFSGKNGSIAEASSYTYTNIRRSLSRFCSWAFTQILKENYTFKELLVSNNPVRKSGNVSEETKNVISSMWKMAKQDARNINEEEGIAVFGKTINTLLARENDYHPGIYLRAVGVHPGLLYPPNRSNNRFVISQDILEMLLMCTVEPGEYATSTLIRKRLWENCGVFVGGSTFEEDLVRNSGMSIQADVDALEQNFEKFAATMEALGFADVMADGILQIHLGGA